MEEYRKSLSSRLIPDSEREYYLALNKAYDDVVARLGRIESKLAKGQKSYLGTEWEWSRTQLNSIVKNIEEELNKLSIGFREEFKKELPELTMYDHIASVDEYQYTLEAGGTAATLKKINKDRMAKIIKTDNLLFVYKTKKGDKKASVSVKSLLASPADNAVKKIKSIITAGAIAGDSPTKIARDIKRDFVSVNKYNTRTVVRTLMAEAQTSADKQMYKDNEEYIQHFIYVATLDTRTTTICRFYDGRVYKQYPPMKYVPPLHPNCRSDLVAIPHGYEPKQRPVNLMTAYDKKKARAIKDPHEREKFLKSKIFTTSSNLTYKEAIEKYPPLKESGAIKKSYYIEKLGIVV